MTIDHQIKDKKGQYDTDREAAKEIVKKFYRLIKNK